MRALRRLTTPAVLSLALLGATPGAQAATSEDKLLAELRRLAERVDRLEKRNADLEARIAGSPTPNEAALATRVEALEKANQDMAAALESERISEKAPEIITRLKAIESPSLTYQAQARKIEVFEGISAEASMVAVAQSLSKHGTTDDKSETRLNWRGDVSVTLPGGHIGDASGAFFAHVRLGQGNGFSNPRKTFTSNYNSTAFQLAYDNGDKNSANSTALLAEAWYQLDVPLPLGGFKEHSRAHLEINLGKMDPFVFFDQNAVADNEADKFLNNVFVHNPMLDSGGAMGLDQYGFTPGLRVAYHGDEDEPNSWRASVAVFGAGEGADFGNSFTQPMVIGQLEFYRRLLGGLPGTYRVYAWNNPQYQSYDGSIGRNLGWGLSIDQQVHEDLLLFARYGQTMSGKVAFDRAVTVGAEVEGNAWGRGADRVGLAWAWLRASDGFRGAATHLSGYGFKASGAEQTTELYYRYRLNKNVSFSPDLQYLHRPAGDQEKEDITALGVRAHYAF